MKKILLLCLILQACTTQKVQTINVQNPKILMFIKQSESSIEKNKNKTKSWHEELQKRFSNLYFVSSYFNVESSLSFKEQLEKAKKEVNPKYVFSYEYYPEISYTVKNKYVVILSDSSNSIIKDKVYHDWAYISTLNIFQDFLVLDSLK